MRPATCKGCGRAVVWVMGDNGAKLMLDSTAPTYRIEKDMLGEFRAVKSEARVLHFSTCSKANDFSRGKKFDQHGPVPFMARGR